MNNSKISSTLRACCFMLLTFALVLGTGSATFGQSRSDIKTEFQNALKKLPNAATTQKLSAADQRKVNATRALYEQGLNFESMNSTQTDNFLQSFESNSSSLKTSEPSCVQKCVNEQSQCVLDRCGPNTTYPCFCCIPCNIIMDLCIFDCLVDIVIGNKSAQPVNH